MTQKKRIRHCAGSAQEKRSFFLRISRRLGGRVKSWCPALVPVI